MSIERNSLIAMLVCPLCKGHLFFHNDELICRADMLAFPIRDQIPMMLPAEARTCTAEEVEKLS